MFHWHECDCLNEHGRMMSPKWIELNWKLISSSTFLSRHICRSDVRHFGQCAHTKNKHRNAYKIGVNIIVIICFTIVFCGLRISKCKHLTFPNTFCAAECLDVSDSPSYRRHTNTNTHSHCILLIFMMQTEQIGLLNIAQQQREAVAVALFFWSWQVLLSLGD